jgi:hypothetical protein
VILEEMDCDPVADTLRDCVTLDDPDKEAVAEDEGVNVTLEDALELGDEDWLDVSDCVSDGDPVTDGDDDTYDDGRGHGHGHGYGDDDDDDANGDNGDVCGHGNAMKMVMAMPLMMLG